MAARAWAPALIFVRSSANFLGLGLSSAIDLEGPRVFGPRLPVVVDPRRRDVSDCGLIDQNVPGDLQLIPDLPHHRKRQRSRVATLEPPIRTAAIGG